LRLWIVLSQCQLSHVTGAAVRDGDAVVETVDCAESDSAVCDASTLSGQ